MSKTASIIELSLPFLIKSFEDLSPKIIDIASIKTDFPEPVSPVKTLKPSSNFIDSSNCENYSEETFQINVISENKKSFIEQCRCFQD